MGDLEKTRGTNVWKQVTRLREITRERLKPRRIELPSVRNSTDPAINRGKVNGTVHRKPQAGKRQPEKLCQAPWPGDNGLRSCFWLRCQAVVTR